MTSVGVVSGLKCSRIRLAAGMIVSSVVFLRKLELTASTCWPIWYMSGPGESLLLCVASKEARAKSIAAPLT